VYAFNKVFAQLLHSLALGFEGGIFLPEHGDRIVSALVVLPDYLILGFELGEALRVREKFLGVVAEGGG